MSDQIEEYHSAISLVCSEYEYLKKLNPGHELLTLTKSTKTGFEITNEEEFTKRYGKNTVDSKKDLMAWLSSDMGISGRYYDSLRKAVKEELENRLEPQGLLEIVRTHF